MHKHSLQEEQANAGILGWFANQQQWKEALWKENRMVAGKWQKTVAILSICACTEEAHPDIREPK